MENYKQIKQDIKNEASHISAHLKEITNRLIELVNQEKIEAFSYMQRGKSTSEQIDNKNYIGINLTLKKQASSVRLGLFDKLEENPQNKILDKEMLQTLSPINDYLAFINTYMPKNNPEIKYNTYYSINALHGLGGFEREPVKHLLPEFMEENKTTKNNKIKK